MATKQQQVDFVNLYGGYAQDASNKTGIPSTYILGQWALETGYGTQFAGQNNLGNIQGNAAKPYDYSSIQAGVNAYAQTLNNPRYALAKITTTPEGFANAMKMGGYATDPDYVDKVTNTINSLNTLVNGEYGGSITGKQGDGATFLADPLGFVKSRALDVSLIVIGGGLIIFLLINATKGQIAEAVVKEVL